MKYFFVRSGFEWADIVIDDDGLLFMAYSTFGNYAYRWQNIGSMSFRDFLAKLDFGYFMSKAKDGPWQIFDADKMYAALEKDILVMRRRDEIDRETARNAWDELSGVDTNGDERDFYDSLFDGKTLSELFGDIYEDGKMKNCPQAEGFWKTIWPVFLDEISGENAEGTTVEN